jgi:hypothetical protein
MAAVNEPIQTLQEITVAQRVAIPHDETTSQHRLPPNTVSDWREFENIIADYYAFHYGRCVAPGTHLCPAGGRNAEALLRAYA